jgi:hypothetical protein
MFLDAGKKPKVQSTTTSAPENQKIKAGINGILLIVRAK